MKKSISILIPVFNGLGYTKKCLHELEQGIAAVCNEKFQFEIIVIDDGSSDDTSNWIKENHPQVHLVFGDGNLWWSGGINAGTRFAIDILKTDFILWWNNDIFQAGDYFVELAKILDAMGATTVYGSKIYYAEAPDTIWSFGGEFFPKLGNFHMIGTFHKDNPSFSKPRLVDWYAGMGTVFPVEVIEKIGSLNQEEFPQYHGDSDYTYRAKLAGYPLEVRPELRIWNYTENTGNYHDDSVKKLFSTLSDIKSTYNLKKDLLFYRKYAQSPRAYFLVFRKYFEYIGGFFKWKLLNLIGIKQKLEAGKIRSVGSQQ